MRRSAALMAVAVVMAAGLTGCTAFSDSLSNSISTSVSSPFKWSSGSSSGSSAEQKETYQGDVRKFAEVCSRSSSSVEELLRGVTAIAEKHGISNWEADMTSFVAIGEGLAKARTSQPQMELYKSGVARGDAARQKAIQQGIDQAG